MMILVPVGVIVALLLFFGLWVGVTYNSIIGLDEGVNNAWANVESAYQRRADLIPNLVAVVKEYSDYEGDLLIEVTKARASVGNANSPQELLESGEDLNSALSKLLVVVESYPNLKANTNYLDLQVQLEGTENRIKVERDLYNSAVQKYNVKVRRFPSNMIAGMFNFDVREMFEADKGSENAPDVDELFDN